MKKIKDLGMQYSTSNSKRKHRFGLYECPMCKKHFRVAMHSVKNKKSTKCLECAILVKSTHKMSKHKLFNIWVEQQRRCTNRKHKEYKNYGQRGINFSEEFTNFKIWLTYVESLPHAYKKTYTIDRIDTNGNYEKGNLRWASKSTQARNTRKIYRSNTSGYRGVGYYKQSKKWRAYIRINSKDVHLGYFSFPWTAAYAYDSYILIHSLEHTRNFK